MRKLKLIALTSLLAVVAIAGSACTDSSTQTDKRATDEQMKQYQEGQPLPAFDRSQSRQTLIDVVTIRAESITTTSFFMMVGAPDPVFMCPSIGVPIPGTWSLTNPVQTAGSNGAVVAQAEPDGIYTGDTDATSTICVDGNGKTFMFYHEGPVANVTGPATWNYDRNQIELTGSPSFSPTNVSE
jgi:hypothetical protein